MDTGELWLSATRQVEATSVSVQGVANRQNDDEGSVKGQSYHRAPQNQKRRASENSTIKIYIQIHIHIHQ